MHCCEQEQWHPVPLLGDVFATPVGGAGVMPAIEVRSLRALVNTPTRNGGVQSEKRHGTIENVEAIFCAESIL